MKLRDYQQNIYDQLISSNTDDIVQLDTGAGKTPIEAALAKWAPRCIVVAHRNMLIEQISEKLAAFGLEHDTISTEHTRRKCMAAHRSHGRNCVRRGHATRLVASIQSFVSAVKRGRLTIDTSAEWLIVIDEAHHVVNHNMWGQLRDRIPNCRIVGFTATPARMDGESLHKAKGGAFDRLVQATSLGSDSTAVLISRGYLSSFVAYAPVTMNHADLSKRSSGTQQDLDAHWEKMLLIERERKPQLHGLNWDSGVLYLMGNPVKEYQRLAAGRRAILMAPSIENARLFAVDFLSSGVSSACIDSTQSPAQISSILDAFRSGAIKVLTNVDMVGEGFDLPACDALIIATATKSFPRYRQWCGRVLRANPGKDRAVIIDLTGMVAQFGAPDEPVKWDLINPPCGPMTKKMVPCTACGAFFAITDPICPECGSENRWLEDWGQERMPGSYVFDIKMIDRSYFLTAVAGRAQARDAERMRTELLKPHTGFGSDIIGRTLNELSEWFAQQLVEAGVSICEVNGFLTSNDAKDRRFFMSHFTRNDVGKGPKKAIKVFKKWQQGSR